VFIILIAVWESAVRFGLVEERLLAPPSAVATTFWTALTDGPLLSHMMSSGQIFVVGYVIAVILAIPLGLLMGVSRRIDLILNPFVLGMYATPSQAFFPLIIIALGIGFLPRLLLVVLFVFFIVVISTKSAVQTVDPNFLKVGRSFGAARGATFLKIILPAALPLIVAGLRLGVGRAAVGIFIGEMVGASEGIGFYILRAGTAYRIDELLVGVTVIVVVTILLTELMRDVEQRMSPWRHRTEL
jgi:NitT/TauT family transport system permease protein